MALFKRQPKIEVCDMCGKADIEGCGSAANHVVEIRGDQPSWLPPNLRAQAQGEFTYLCLLCNSFPAMKWPGDGGAWSGMQIHLGQKHGKGNFAGAAHGMPKQEMIPVR